MDVLMLGEVPWAVGGGVMMLVFMVVGLLTTVFWLWMLVDALMNEPSGTEKILWVLVIVFLHVLGALLYFFIRRGARTPGTRVG